MSGAADPIMRALEQFDASEANITKLQTLWAEIKDLTPDGIMLGLNGRRIYR